jgi:hypothetical protein
VMQRSFSSSAADHQHHPCSSTGTRRHLPVHLVSNHGSNDYYSSDTNTTQRQTFLQRASSTSSVSSASSTGSGGYCILPVRYSSVDRVLQKPPKVTANERGINVRIHFDRRRRHHHRQREQRTEDYEHSHKKHMTKEENHYGSCPVLNETRGKSNITYIETRSIVRDASTDQMNRNLHSNELIMRERTMPSSPVTNMRIKHIPLSTPVVTRVIREEEECTAEIFPGTVIITNRFFLLSF